MSLFSPLRLQLFAIFVLTLSPLVWFHSQTLIHQREQDEREVYADAERVVRDAVRTEDDIVVETRAVLEGLVLLPEVRSGDREACSAALAGALAEHPQYLSFSVASLDGTIWCSALPFTGTVAVADRLWYQNTVQTKQFSIGEYSIGRISKQPTVAFGYPVFDVNGDLQQVVVAALDLGWISELAREVGLPLGSTLTVFDGNGVVLAREPDGGSYVGKSSLDSPIVRALIDSHEEGVTRAIGLDGIDRLYAYAPLFSSNGTVGAYISVGIPTEVAFAATDAEIRKALVLFVVVFVGFMLLAGLFVEIAVIRHMRRLVAACQKLSTGDLTVRIGAPYPVGEIGQLMRSFDETGKALLLRDEQIGRMTRALRVLSGGNHLLVHAEEEDNLLDGITKVLKDSGKYREAWFGNGTESPEAKRAVSTDEPVVVRGQDDGSASLVILPMRSGDQSLGVLNVSSDDPAAFNDEETRLLHETAMDAAFGIRSIRERKEHERVEVAVKQSEQRYRSYIENSIDGVFVTADNGRIVDVNPAACDLLGYSKDELTTKTLRDLVDHRLTERQKLDFLLKLVRDGRNGMDATLVRKDGSDMIADIRMVHLQGNGNLGLFRDITERVNAEKTLKEANDLKSRFITVLSHQLRTPLNAIRWNLESIITGRLGRVSKAQKEILRTSYDADSEVIRRIHDMLTAMDIEEGRMVLSKDGVDVVSLWKSVMGVLRDRCEAKDINCELADSEESIPPILADAEKIRVVLEKLLENAVIYTPKGGQVRAQMKRVGPNVRFEVTDTGIGIPPAEQSRIFTRFYRATNASVMQPDASGLGLAIAKYFVEQHGGKIGFTSEEGKGSTFWFELPLA